MPRKPFPPSHLQKETVQRGFHSEGGQAYAGYLRRRVTSPKGEPTDADKIRALLIDERTQVPNPVSSRGEVAAKAGITDMRSGRVRVEQLEEQLAQELARLAKE